jgi:hypothetical protein
VTLVVEFMLGFVGLLRIVVFPPGRRIERPDVLHELEWLHGHTLIMMAMCEKFKLVDVMISILAIQQILTLSYLPVAKILSEASRAQRILPDF